MGLKTGWEGGSVHAHAGTLGSACYISECWKAGMPLITCGCALYPSPNPCSPCRSLSRPYARVDRPRLKRKMLSECVRHGVQFHSVKAEDATHGDGRSTLRCSDGSQVTASLVLDASGHSRSLVKYDTNFDPGEST